MKSVVVPLDFTAADQPVIAAAIRYGREIGARVLMMHASIATPRARSGHSLTRLWSALLAASDRKLETIRRAVGKNVEALPTESGDPASVIVSQARKDRARVIVMADHGHGALHDLLVGSVARRLIREAICPLLVVPVTATRGSASRSDRKSRP